MASQNNSTMSIDGAAAGPSRLTSSSNGATGSAPSAAAAKKPRKPREPKAPKASPSGQAADGGGASNNGSSGADVKPLHRPVMVCRRCRTKKIKCDLGFPSCGPCLKANESCVGLDPATGREVSRSYVAELEDRVSQLTKELEAARGKPGVGTSSGPSTEVQSKRHLGDPDGPRGSGRPAKRLHRDPDATNEAGSSRAQHLVLGPNGVESLTSDGYRPASRPLNAYVSGLSPARLLCQAIQQSASAGLRLRDVRRDAAGKRPGQGTPKDAKPAASRRGKVEIDPIKPSQIVKKEGDGPTEVEGEVSAGKDAAKDSLEAPESLSPTADNGKKQSPLVDAEAMQYAETTETSDITVPAPEQLAQPSPLPAPFPPVPVARKLVDAFFQRVNPQWPMLDRDSFMQRFDAACRDGLARARAKIEAQARAEGRKLVDFKEDEVEIELQPADGHLFHLVLAIAAAMGWVQARFSAERHHEAAMLYLDPRRASTHTQGVGAIMGRDSLEQLQCLLLTALYSMMRAVRPGIWYTLGVALRLTTGLGLYAEKPGGQLKGAMAGEATTETLAEKKRRLFWCAYSIDRSVGVHLGRPFGIADTDIRVALPWTCASDGGRDAALHRGEDEHDADESMSANGFDERASDTSTERLRKEAASTLAALGESRASSPAPTPATSVGPLSSARASFERPKEGSRWVSLSFFRLRILQSEIQGLLFSNAELPRRFASFEHWKIDMLDRLADWRAYAPSSKEELERCGCGYNPIFLELNFRQTLLMIYGMSPRFPTPSRSDLAHVEDCSRVILDIYAVLAREGQMNYEWMTGHLLFIACTSYLYSLWTTSTLHPETLRSSSARGEPSKMAEIERYGKACDDVLLSLRWYAAERCRKCLKTMFAATAGMVEKQERMAAASLASKNAATDGHHGPQQPRENQAPPRQQQHQQQQHSFARSQYPPPASATDEQKERWWDTMRESSFGWDASRTSDVRSENAPTSRVDSPGISARSLYTQEPPSRMQTAAGSITARGSHAMLPPGPGWQAGSPPSGSGAGNGTGATCSPNGRLPPTTSGTSSRSRSGSRTSVYYSVDSGSMARSPQMSGAGAQHADARLSWKTGSSPRFTPGTLGPSYLTARSPTGSVGPYAMDHRAGGIGDDQHYGSPSLYGAPAQPAAAGSTPSSGLEFDALGGVGGSPGSLLRQTLGASPGRISVHSSSADSPTHIDFSSLMADSAMELDQLFRDAGLSINFDVDGGYQEAPQGHALPAPQPLQQQQQQQQPQHHAAGIVPASSGAVGEHAGTGYLSSGFSFADVRGGHPSTEGGSGLPMTATGLDGGYGPAGLFDGTASSTTTTMAAGRGGHAGWQGAGGAFGGAVTMSDDGLENDYDWEAMGFGFRMNQTLLGGDGHHGTGGGGQPQQSAQF